MSLWMRWVILVYLCSLFIFGNQKCEFYFKMKGQKENGIYNFNPKKKIL